MKFIKKIKCSVNFHNWGDWNISPNSKNSYDCLKIKKCRECGETEINYSSHDWNNWEKKPNCKEERKCNVCNKLEKKTSIHEWEKWVENEKCHFARKCKNCGKKDSKIEHKWEEEEEGDLILKNCKSCRKQTKEEKIIKTSDDDNYTFSDDDFYCPHGIYFGPPDTNGVTFYCPECQSG